VRLGFLNLLFVHHEKEVETVMINICLFIFFHLVIVVPLLVKRRSMTIQWKKNQQKTTKGQNIIYKTQKTKD
jgi:hypothetical protein